MAHAAQNYLLPMLSSQEIISAYFSVITMLSFQVLVITEAMQVGMVVLSSFSLVNDLKVLSISISSNTGFSARKYIATYFLYRN